MADFTALKTAIQNAIKQNGNEEITGNLLQDVLLAIVTTLGEGNINNLINSLDAEVTARQQAVSAEAQARQLADSTLQGGINTVSAAITAINNAIGNGCVYAGIATPSSTPASGKVFYLALTAGTYTNFNSLEVPQGINILKNNGSTWSLDAFVGIDDTPTPSSNNLVKSGGVFNDIMTNGSAFDLSAYNNGTTYADLNAALTALNALPAAFKKGGMSMKFVLTSDNKYMQFRLKANAFTTDIDEWQDLNNIEEYLQETFASNVLPFSLNIIEQGGMSITANGSYAKRDSQYNTRLRLKSSAIHLTQGSEIHGTEGCQLYIGGMYDDNTPIPRGFMFTDGGTYKCAKDGMYALILVYTNEPTFDGSTYTPEDLCSHYFIQGKQITELHKDISDLSKIVSLIAEDQSLNGVDLPFEIGHVKMTTNPWEYIENTKRIRIEEDSLIPLNKGTVLSLSDYSNYHYYVGWKIDGVPFYHNGWLTEDYICTEDGYYSILIARINDEITLSNVEELSHLFNVACKSKISALEEDINEIDEELARTTKKTTVRNIAHQGYTTTSRTTGDNLAAAYVKAAEKGFDWGETDIVFSSDDVPFCCHNESFVDPDTQDEVVFANNTAAQIKEHSYMVSGIKVSTFDEVIAACKSVGLGIYIDKIARITDSTKWETVFNILKKYCMLDKAVFMPTTKEVAQTILTYYDCAKICFIRPLNATTIEEANSVKTPYNEISFDVNYQSYTTEQLAAFYLQLAPGITINVYTVDDINAYREYLPFVSGITSNKYCETNIE